MTRLADIPIRVEGTFAAPAAAQPDAPEAATSHRDANDLGLGGGVAAVLSELATLLERIGPGSAASSIDVRSLPMNARDRLQLRSVLGEGEVSATVTALGVSSVRETGVAGVWWVEHFDRGGTSIAESLEVAAVPRILARADDEMAAAAVELRRRGAAAVALTGAWK